MAGLYLRLLGARVRSDWQYRTSFITLFFAQTLVTAFEFVALLLILQLVPTLGGWTTSEVAFLYALATVPFSISDLLASSVETTATHVQAGTFDRFLLRPLPAIFQVTAAEFELRRAGKALPAIGVGVWAIANVDIAWTPTRIAVLVMAVVCGTLIYSGLWIATASISFWAVASRETANAVTYGGQFANEYPLHLYRDWIRATLGWGIPLAFVSYVPTQWLLGAENPLGLPGYLVFATPAVAAAVVGVSLVCWSTGIRHYQSTGS